MNVYKELLERFYEERGTDIQNFTKDKELESLLKTLAICGEIKDKYSIDLTDTKLFNTFNVSSIDRFNANVRMGGGDGYIGVFSEIYNSDKQPLGEQMLLKISHPTGAYIFGEYYPSDLFDEFFEELKFKTKVEYVDRLNHSLFYTLENALESLSTYTQVYKEYIEKNKKHYKKFMIKKKREELERLEKEENV